MLISKNFLTREASYKPSYLGCGWHPEKIERLIDRNTVVQAMFRKAITDQQGEHHHDNIMMKAGQGTSRSYTVSRLKRDHASRRSD